jgi:hypothetical protein
MAPPRLQVFDSWFDGNMSLALRIVNVFEASKSFTLKEFVGQEAFYEEYLTKYDEYVDMLTEIAEGNLEVRMIELIDTLRSALYQIAGQHRLTFGHLLMAYTQLLAMADRENEIGSEMDVTPILIRDRNFPQFSVEEIVRLLDTFAERHPRVVPFTSLNGAFGFNTFLYLYFNGIHPVSCSMKPLEVHNGRFYGSVNIQTHDWVHMRHYRAIDQTLHDDLGIQDIKVMKRDLSRYTQLPEYFAKLKECYFELINTTNLPEGQIKGMIVYLFKHIHEEATPISCSKLSYKYLGEDPAALIRTSYYTPERYNVDRLDVVNDLDNEIVSRHSAARTYAIRAMKEIHNDFCRLFGVGLPETYTRR